MWFIGQFENGSWGFQQEGCPPRYTSKHEAETIRDMYEALKNSRDFLTITLGLINTPEGTAALKSMIEEDNRALAKAEGK